MTIESALEEISILKSSLDHRESYIRQLEDAVKLLRHRQFGTKSEKIDNLDDQMLFNEIDISIDPSLDESDDDDSQLDIIHVGAHTKKRPKRKPLPKDLPREIVEIDLSKSEKICPHDGEELKLVGHESSERVDIIPMQVRVIETRRLTYACPCCQAFMKTAAVPPTIVPKGLPTAGTLAFMATTKFVDGVSLYHASKMIERHSGLEISRGSMANWMVRTYEHAVPLLNLLNDEAIASSYLLMDETTTKVLKEEDRKPETKSYMWIRFKPGPRAVVLFDYDPRRRADVAKRLLLEFKGKLQCDGYSGYDWIDGSSGIIRFGCWAHARRKLYEAVKVGSNTKTGVAKYLLKLVERLYAVEALTKGQTLENVVRIRQEKAKPILEKIHEWVEQHLRSIPPKSPTGKALLYIHNEWPHLEKYVDYGDVMIDNNLVENKIRPFVVGRKRWLFNDTVAGANASAALYSLVETAKANDIEPYAYLKHVFERLPACQTLADYEGLLPWNAKL